MNLFILLVFAAFHCSFGDEICHDPCGCHSDDPPFDNMPLPESIFAIGIEFRLFTRRNPSSYIVVGLDDAPPSEFDASQRTVFMMHGWTEDGSAFEEIKDNMLESFDHNVFLVNWFPGSGRLDYWQSAANTRVVGTCASVLAERWIASHGLAWDRVYCVGLSLGGQTCGFMGKASSGNLGRITALDPAGPAFEKEDPAGRLDATDAVTVDTIHTDGYELGLGYDVSDIDIYPNKGVNPQPPCTGGLCSHAVSRDYFRASIDISETCIFSAHPCNSNADADDGNCDTCQQGVDCQRMGYYADTMPGRGSFFLRTTASYPYCEDPAKK